MWVNTVATEGMLGNLNPLGDGPGRSSADHGARVPEVLPAAELEGFFDCWWALFGNRAAEKQQRVTVYTKHQLTLQKP